MENFRTEGRSKLVIDIRTPSIFGRAIFVTKQVIILIAPGYQTLRSVNNTLPTHSIKIVVQMVSCPHQIYNYLKDFGHIVQKPSNRDFGQML